MSLRRPRGAYRPPTTRLTRIARRMSLPDLYDSIELEIIRLGRSFDEHRRGVEEPEEVDRCLSNVRELFDVLRERQSSTS